MEFTKEQINAWKGIFESAEYKTETVGLGGRFIDYSIVSNSLFPKVDGLVLAMNSEDERLVCVSDGVVKYVQPHFALSKHIQLGDYYPDMEALLKSEKDMMAIFENDIGLRTVYISSKLKMYKDQLKLTDECYANYFFEEKNTEIIKAARDYLLSIN